MDSARLRTYAFNPSELGCLGSRGLLKKYEFIRILLNALTSLGFNGTASCLEEESGVLLYDHNTKNFLELVKERNWVESIDALKDFELPDDKAKALRLLLLVHHFYELVHNEQFLDALTFFEEKIRPVDVENQLGDDIGSILVARSIPPISIPKVMEKVQSLFPPEVIIPTTRLEFLLERILVDQLEECNLHNVPDSKMSLYSDHHHCGIQNIPSQTVQTLEEHTDEVCFLDFSHNGKYLASSSRDKSALIWEMDSEGTFSRKHKLVGHEKPVIMVFWSPDDKYVLTCGENEIIKRWAVDRGNCVGSYGLEGVGSVSCAWLHDGSGIISGMKNHTIWLWKFDGNQIPIEADHSIKNASELAVTTDGKWLVSMGNWNEVVFVDIETSAVEKRISENDWVTSFSLSIDSNYILINLKSATDISVWFNDQQGTEPEKYSDDNGATPGRFIRSSFGGYRDNFLASGKDDGQVYLWHRSLEKPIRRLEGHTRAVTCVSWNPTYLHLLASASSDGTIRIWGPARS